MAWTDPTTRSASEFLEATDWNTDVTDNMLYLLAVKEPALTNKSGSSVSSGTVIIIDSSNDSSFTTTTNADDPLVIGVAGETISNDASGKIIQSGPATVLVQGNVTRGNFLSTSTTAGRAKDAGTTQNLGTFACALTGYSGGGAGTVTALLFPSFVGDVVPANLIAFTVDGSAPTGFVEYTAARGRVIVGLPASGTNEGTVKSALGGDLIDDVDASAGHTHTQNTIISHSHTLAYESGGAGSSTYVRRGNGTTFYTRVPDSTVATGGDTGGNSTYEQKIIMPYIQLMTIQKS